MRPKLRAALDRSWERNANVYRELAEADSDLRE